MSCLFIISVLKEQLRGFRFGNEFLFAFRYWQAARLFNAYHFDERAVRWWGQNQSHHSFTRKKNHLFAMTISSACDTNALWFEPLSRTKTPSLRVFCLPYAGGSADIYRRWQRWFPHQVDICLVHLPGRGQRVREEPFTRLTPLVEAIAAHIDGEIKIPYVLYGHSMGALISFELGRELRGKHRNSPAHIFVSGCRAPQWPKTEPPTFNLPHDKFVDELKRLNGTPREVLDDAKIMEVFLSILRADFEIVDTYEFHPKERLSCPITVYGGLQDEDVPVESCHAWQEQTSASCAVQMFEGDHFFIRDPQSKFGWTFRNDIMRVFSVLRQQRI